MSMAEKIRIMRVKRGNLSERDLAARIGDTPQNLNNKMKRDDFRLSELEKIASGLGYKVEIKFIDVETGEEFK
ncbi:MAG: XRE family transcriptional regulator [Schwartzia sp.]|nr:transcriptional regulator [Clostridia bacterium]MBQ9633996.1 XRE family transcriptional regulator [Schwartzia sp. (in: firmicutes)]